MKLLTILLIINFCFSQNNKVIFDPSQLNDPEPRWPKMISPLTSDSHWVKNDSTGSIELIIEGFRVQVLATGDKGTAENLKTKLSLDLEESIYIVFEAPNYKVRIGNFIDRNSAESLRQSLVDSGYPSSWIIRTRIEPNFE